MPLSAFLGFVRADVLERTRRYGFLVTLLFALWAANGMLPPQGSRYVTMRYGDHRGLYNSPYVGVVVAVLTATFLSLIGFYLVKNSVDRDRRTGVGQILAATPLSRLAYLGAKAASNFVVLAAIAGTVAVAAVALQLVRGESTRLDLPALFAPMLWLALPTLLLTSCLAVLFECVPWLKGGGGNIAWFFTWTALMMAAIPSGPLSGPGGDPLGVQVVLRSIGEAVHARYPSEPVRAISLGIQILDRPGSFDTFVWNGIDWLRESAPSRLAWSVIALAPLGLAALAFDRFDTAPREPLDRPRGRRRRSRGASGPVDGEAPSPGPVAASGADEPAAAPPSVATLVRPSLAYGMPPLVVAELRVMFKGIRRGWWVVFLGLAIACTFAPLTIVRAGLLPFVWIWPVLLWSGLGSREHRHGVRDLLASAPRPIGRQLLAQWISGAALAALAALPYAARALAAGEAAALAGVVAGVLFVPSFALAAGVWTGSGKLFEACFVALWYMGPLNGTAALDFTGQVPGARGAHLGFLIAGLVLFAAAFAGRARSLRR